MHSASIRTSCEVGVVERPRDGEVDDLQLQGFTEDGLEANYPQGTGGDDTYALGDPRRMSFPPSTCSPISQRGLICE